MNQGPRKLLTFFLPFLLLVAALAASAEEFEWSWDQGESIVDEEISEAGEEGFEFSAELGEEGPEAIEDAERIQEGPTKAIDTAAYGELLEKNLELRRKIAEASGSAKITRNENERLSREVNDLGQRIGRLTLVIRDLEKEKSSSLKSLNKVLELESLLAGAKEERDRLGNELDALQERITGLRTEQVEPAPAVTAMVRPGSDLFRQIEKENILLKDKLVEIETKRQKAVEAWQGIVKKGEEADGKVKRASEKQKEMKKELAEARSVGKQQRQEINKLLKKMPDLEKELSELKTTLKKKDTAFTAGEMDIATLKSELQMREHRLIKAERMTALLEKAREEVRQVSDTEKRDMHYNMAAVYAKEGKFRDAEREYLRALRLDPADAVVHYNLGILYDDNLNNKRRAAMHYRRFLKLSPHSEDVDAVKDWLMRIEMNR